MSNTRAVYFNIDNSVTILAEVHGTTVGALFTVVNGVDRDAVELLGLPRALNVKSSIQYMMDEPAIVSTKTECGVIVRRNIAKQH